MPIINGVKEIQDVQLTKEQYKGIAFLVPWLQKLPYRKLDNGNYKAYCTGCMEQHEYSKNEFKLIRHNGQCPKCKRYFKSTTKAQDIYRFENLVRVGDYGYRVSVELDIDKEPKILSFEQMAYFGDPTCMWLRNSKVYYINWNANGIAEDPTKYNYYKSYSRYAAERFINYYGTYSYSKNLLKGIDLKKFYEINFPKITKSNQRKLIYDNHFTLNEIRAVKLFDLKTKEDVIKYSQYINKQVDLDNLYANKQFNIYHLDYLSRNNIDLGMYSRYLDRAKALGFKPDKPKDFNARLKVIDELETKEQIRREVAKNRVHDDNIAKRYNELPKYEKDNIAIKPFYNSEEIITCGKRLHNCIGSYVQRYSEKNTDIYHLDIDGAIKIAIEIRNNCLQQAHADHNSKCPDDLLKHIKSFCKTNHISLGSYA